MRGLKFTVAAFCLICGGAAQAQTENWTWRGQCQRGTRTANATLILRIGLSDIRGGTLNGKEISSVQYEEGNGEISFNAPGIFQDQNIIRRFNGTINEDNGELAGTLSQDDGRFATCRLSFQES